MSVLKKILDELDEMFIVNNISNKHIEARMKYPKRILTVSDDTEFDDMIADYYNYHFTTCISQGGKLSRAEAASRAKEIIERDYRRKGKDKLNAYFDGKHGSSEGGMQGIFDIIMNSLRQEAISNHIQDVIDRYIRPTSYKEQLEIVKEIFGHMSYVPPYIDISNPEQYVQDYAELIRALSESITRNAAKIRRI